MLIKLNIMKNILFTISLILFTNFLFSQTIIDMAGEPVNGEMENGQYYIKDVNNFMLPYLGTWKYINGNKEFRITLTKVPMFHVVFSDYNTDYYKDGLLIQYQKYENGQLIYNSQIGTYPTGIIKEYGKLNMSFTDYERNGESFPVDLTLFSEMNSNVEYLKFKIDKFERSNTYYDQHPNEPYFSVPNDIVMTKM